METEKRSIIEYNQNIHAHLKEIFAPIFEFFQNLSIGYTRYYQDGSRIIIESNTEWLKPYFSSNISDETLQNNIYQAMHRQEKKVVDVTTGAPTSVVHSLLYDFNLWNCVSYHYANEEYVEAFHFETERDNFEILAIQATRPFVLEQIIFYMREKFNALKINEAPRILSQSDLLLPSSSKMKRIKAEKNKLNQKQLNLEMMLEKIKPSKFYIQSDKFYLTMREAACLYYLSKGSTNKDIAKTLNISHRTVESYISSIKEKIGVNYKNELLTWFNNSMSYMDDFFDS